MEISGAAALEDAGANELSFAYGRKGIAAARGSGAGCLIVDADFPSGRTLLRAPDPRAYFAMALKLLYPAKTFAAGVHASANGIPVRGFVFNASGFSIVYSSGKSAYFFGGSTLSAAIV